MSDDELELECECPDDTCADACPCLVHHDEDDEPDEAYDISHSDPAYKDSEGAE